MNSLRILFAQTSAVMSGTGIISTYLVKWSVRSKMKRLPRLGTGNGPRKSVATQSPGAPAGRRPNGARGLFLVSCPLHRCRISGYRL